MNENQEQVCPMLPEQREAWAEVSKLRNELVAAESASWKKPRKIRTVKDLEAIISAD